MAKRKENLAEEYNEHTKRLEESFRRWDELKKNGGQDPLYADGVNLNLVRNHIIYDKGELERICKASLFKLPDIYYEETPEQVSMDYMARPEEIRHNALRTLNTLQAHPDYKYLVSLRSMAEGLDKKSVLRNAVLCGISVVDMLKLVFKEDDLVALRRYENTERRIDDLTRTAEKAREIIASGKENELFSNDYDNEPEDAPQCDMGESASDGQGKEEAEEDSAPRPAMEQMRLF